MAVHAVVGASGNTGSVVVETLVSAGHQVRAIVRSPEKAQSLGAPGVEVVVADLTDAKAIARGLAGVAGAYLINPPAETRPDPLRHAMLIADALARGVEEAEVKQVVLLSSVGGHLPARTGLILTTHLTEQRFRSVATRTTVLRCAFFLENWLATMPDALKTGVMRSELQDVNTPRAFVGAKDIGTTAAAILTGEMPFAPLIELKGAQDWAPAEIADALGRVSGTAIRAEAVPKAAWAEPLRAHGLSDAAVDGYVEMYEAFDSGFVAFEGTGVNLRGAQPLEQWAATALSKARTSAKEHAGVMA